MASKKWISEAVSAMKAIGIPEERVRPVIKKLLRVYKTNWKLIEDENYRVLADAIFEDQENKEEEVEKEKEASVHDEFSQPPLTRLRMKKQEDNMYLSGVTSSPNPKKGRGVRTATSSSLVCFKELEVESGCLLVPTEKPNSRQNAGLIKSNEESTVDFHSLSRKELQALCKKKKIPANWKNVAMADALTALTKDEEAKKIKEAALHDESSEPPLKRMRLVKQEDQASPSGVTAIRKPRTGRDVCPRRPSFAVCSKAREVGINRLTKENVPDSQKNGGLIKPRSECFTDDFAMLEDPIAITHPPIPVLTRNEGESLIFHSSNAVISPEIPSKLFLNGPESHPNQNSQTVDDMRLPHNFSDIFREEDRVLLSLVNAVSREPYPPAFKYIAGNIVYKHADANASLAKVGDEDCCPNCFGDCLSSSVPCACSRKSRGEFAYTLEGLIKEQFLDECISISRNPEEHQHNYCNICPLERFKEGSQTCKGHPARKFIKECWSKCGCSKGCGNRVVQRGITCNLQVFLTSEGKGWGLRTLTDLPKGTFVCEYVGEILTNSELCDRNMRRSGNEKHTYTVLLDANWGSKKVLEDKEALCLDATYYGNVARFINHRCFDANLVDIPVEVEIPDHHYYHLAFFTTRQINALEELTWDYGINFDYDYHPMKAFQCRCGSGCCRDMKRSHRTKSRRWIRND